MTVGSIVVGGSGIEGTVDRGAGLGCDFGIVCNLGLVIFLLTTALSYAFLGSTGKIPF